MSKRHIKSITKTDGKKKETAELKYDDAGRISEYYVNGKLQNKYSYTDNTITIAEGGDRYEYTISNGRITKSNIYYDGEYVEINKIFTYNNNSQLVSIVSTEKEQGHTYTSTSKWTWDGVNLASWIGKNDEDTETSQFSYYNDITAEPIVRALFGFNPSLNIDDFYELIAIYPYIGALPQGLFKNVVENDAEGRTWNYNYSYKQNSNGDIVEVTVTYTGHTYVYTLDWDNVEEGTDAKVKLNKSKATLLKGKTLTLKATVLPETLEDKSVTWKSSNKKVATVSSKGKVKGIKTGTATITCTSKATGVTAKCKVTVVNGTVKLNKTELFIEKGTKKTLKATLTPTTLKDKSVTWTSSNKKIATVSSTGKVKGVKYGTAIITCTSKATGATASCTVTIGKVVISMEDFTLKKSRTTVLTATLYPTNLEDKSVIWKSSNEKIATVTNEGKVKGIKAGTATITCTSVATGLSGTCTVTVLAKTESRSLDGEGEGTTGIDGLENAATAPFDVYDLNGRKVLSGVTSLDGLPNGVYVVNGKKMLKK